MQKETTVLFKSGDQWSVNHAVSPCHICGKEIKPGDNFCKFTAIYANDKDSARLKWCELCSKCSFPILNVFRNPKIAPEKKKK